jgi:hypothetical protein
MRIRIYFNLGEISEYSRNIALCFDEILNNLGKKNSQEIAREKLKQIAYYLNKINEVFKIFDEEIKIINECALKNPLELDLDIIFKLNEKIINFVLKKLKNILDLGVFKIYLN